MKSRRAEGRQGGGCDMAKETCPRCGKEHAQLTQRSIASLWRSLREFGYSTLKPTTVREQGGLVMCGKATMEEGLDIIGMMIKAQVEEAGLLKPTDGGGK